MATLLATLADADLADLTWNTLTGEVTIPLDLSIPVTYGSAIVLAWTGGPDSFGSAFGGAADQAGNTLGGAPHGVFAALPAPMFGGFVSTPVRRTVVGPLSTAWSGGNVPNHFAVYAFADVIGGGGQGVTSSGEPSYLDELTSGPSTAWNPPGNVAFAVAFAAAPNFASDTPPDAPAWPAGWTELRQDTTDVVSRSSFAYRLGTVSGEIIEADFGAYKPEWTVPSQVVDSKAFLTARRARSTINVVFGELAHGTPAPPSQNFMMVL